MAWLSGYSYRKKLTIDSTKVAGSLSNFPIVVSIIDDTDLGTKALATGYDINFTLHNGTTPLPYERISFSIAGGVCNALFFVQVPSLDNENIYLYYGKADATDIQNITGVWDDNYKGVWHLEESGTGAAGDYKDSTTSAYNSINTADQPTQTTGKLGYGQSLNGSSSYISLGDTKYILQNSFTVEWWSSGTGCVLGSYAGNKVFVSATGFGIFGEFPAGSWRNYSFKPTVFNSALLNHFAIVFDGTLLTGYLNGSQVSQIAVDATTKIYLWLVGLSGYWGDDHFNGVIDELRISDTNRSSSWISTSYNTQNSPSTFYTVSAEEVYGIPRFLQAEEEGSITKFLQSYGMVI